MPTVVVDASAIAAILFNEPQLSIVLERISGCNLVAPTLIRHELVSVAMKKNRDQPAARSVWQADLRDYGDLHIQEHRIVPAAVFALALETGLTAYDASYLWLARHLGVPLVTLDGNLATAAAN